jgi:hypothetical protein
MALFTFGADAATMPMGESVGSYLSSSKKLWLILGVGLVIGTIVTVAEPDVTILAGQVPGVPPMTLIWTLSLGVGIFLMLALARALFRIRLSVLLIIGYALIFIIAIFVPGDYLPVSFDSGGVTTGPITMPFILAMGVGLTSVRGTKESGEESFGFVALCSTGPILAVLVLSLLFHGENASYTPPVPEQAAGVAAVIARYTHGIPHYAKEVAIALAPIVVMFAIFDIFALKLPAKRLVSMGVGMVFTFIGLVLFLMGANVGFIPIGALLGKGIVEGGIGWAIIPLGMLMGCVAVIAEPAVHVLMKEAENVSSGAIKPKSILISLSIGVGVAVALAMVRVYTGLNIWWLILPGYALAMVLTFFVPPMYTAVAFDAGGVSAGPMTATLLMSFSMGASSASGGNVMRDAFGIIAMVAMAPLVAVQIMGLITTFGQRNKARVPLFGAELEIFDLDWEDAL